MAVWGQLGRLDRGSSSNEFSLQPLAQMPRLVVHVGGPWEQSLPLGWTGSRKLWLVSMAPAFESLFFLLDLTLLICSGTRRCSCLQEDEQAFQEGLLQRGESLGFGL